MPSSMAARMCRMEKYMLFVRSKVFLSLKTALGWSETQPYSRNDFGHFSYAIASSSTPSKSLVVTVQPPVPVGDEVQSLPVFAQLGASDPLYHLQGQGRITPLPLSPRWGHQPSPPPRRTCL